MTKPPSWFALNGYGVLIGLLELFIGLFYFAEIGVGPADIGPVRDVAHVAIGVAGAALIFSYWCARVDIELVASAAIVIGNLTIFVATVFSVSPPNWLLRNTTFQGILIVAVALRMSALFRGGTFRIPAWRTSNGDEK